MKLTMHFPGGHIEIERKPMSEERFGLLCLTFGLCFGGWLFVYLLTSVAR